MNVWYIERGRLGSWLPLEREEVRRMDMFDWLQLFFTAGNFVLALIDYFNKRK